jgi:hypothetical protein
MTTTLNTKLFMEVTPAGAYYAISSNKQEPARDLLLNILSEHSLPILDSTRLTMWSGLQRKESIELVDRLQELGWLCGRKSTLSAPSEPLEKVLPKMLEQVSIEGKALLADDQGFYLCSSGIAHEAAESLSAVSANLSSLYERYQRLLVNNMGIKEQAWTLSNAAGNSQLGFWPLYIGAQRFVLVIQGRPTLNQPAFRDLVWVLAMRYAKQIHLEDVSKK